MLATAANSTPHSTRERLIEAAGEVFARVGFHHATVREICAAAHANLAAVNYHFGEKAELYAAVLHFSLELARVKYPVQAPAGTTPPERLHHFIRMMLSRILDDGRPAWHGKLMMREMAEPTPALKVVVREMIEPTYRELAAIVHDLIQSTHTRQPDAALAPHPSRSLAPDTARRICNSIIGQCLMYKYCQPVITMMEIGEPAPARDQINALARHITHFSLAAIAGLAAEQEVPSPSARHSSSSSAHTHTKAHQ